LVRSRPHQCGKRDIVKNKNNACKHAIFLPHIVCIMNLLLRSIPFLPVTHKDKSYTKTIPDTVSHPFPPVSTRFCA
jgi:hypothetical protein